MGKNIRATWLCVGSVMVVGREWESH
jgi:hypothetical protein